MTKTTVEYEGGEEIRCYDDRKCDINIKMIIMMMAKRGRWVEGEVR